MEDGIKVRTYGVSGAAVVVLHGGPGAAGYMAAVARELADSFRVWEPWQRGSGEVPLTVARHVEDLDEMIKRYCPAERPAVVGHSWGAMLGLAYAAEHPEKVGAVVLIGCGTFDEDARRIMLLRRKKRMDKKTLNQLKRLTEEYPQADERLEVMGQLMRKIDSYDLMPTKNELDSCDARAYEETWSDILRRQQEGVYPSAFARIKVPVLMMHGIDDPHPGQLIKDSLKTYIPHLQYQEWEKCGHYPWQEKAAQNDFFVKLRQWLRRNGSPEKPKI